VPRKTKKYNIERGKEVVTDVIKISFVIYAP
jgi:hypothetical protein